jgi:hypothetical protein
LTGYPSGKDVFAFIPLYARIGNPNENAIINIYDGYIYANAKVSGTVNFGIYVLYRSAT